MSHTVSAAFEFKDGSGTDRLKGWLLDSWKSGRPSYKERKHDGEAHSAHSTQHASTVCRALGQRCDHSSQVVTQKGHGEGGHDRSQQARTKGGHTTNISNKNSQSAAAAVSEKTCGICLEDSKDPQNLPCGHSFCDGCLGGWRSRYGVDEEMRRKCHICRARIPPSKEMVTNLLTCRAHKQKLEDENHTSSKIYRATCQLLAKAEERVGKDWDGVTVLEDTNDKPAAVMPDYVFKAMRKGDIKTVLKWINSNHSEDRANAETSVETASMPMLMLASMNAQMAMMSLLLQLGADVDYRMNQEGVTALSSMFSNLLFAKGGVNQMARLLLSWGASFFPKMAYSRENCISQARKHGNHDLANLIESELGGRRCEIINLLSRPELNGKTCVADEYLPNSNHYKVTLETKSKEGLVISPDNLKRRDRTPQDCGYYIEFKNGRTIRHVFDSSEDCQAFVATLNNKGETQSAVTEEAEARADQATAELLAELGLDDSPNSVFTSSGGQAKKSKKKKRDKKKKKK